LPQPEFTFWTYNASDSYEIGISAFCM